jgi:hypothetical protein
MKKLKVDAHERAMEKPRAKEMDALEVLLAAAAKVQAHFAFISALPDEEEAICADTHLDTTYNWRMELAAAAEAYAQAVWERQEACAADTAAAEKHERDAKPKLRASKLIARSIKWIGGSRSTKKR